MAEILVRNYDPPKDYPSLRANLEAAGLFDEDYEAESRLARWVNVQPDAIVVAQSGTEFVGSVYFQDGILPYIYRLAVRQNMRGQGIGSLLLAEVEQRAKAHGHVAVELNIDRDHPELTGFYARCGYRPAMRLFNMYKLL